MSADSHACDFCGLPVYSPAGNESTYCCYGCKFAASVAAAGGEEGQNRWAMTRLGLAIFFAMNVMVFTMLLWSQPVEGDRLSSIWYDLARYACLLFTLPVVFLLGLPLLEDAASELMCGRPSLSLLLCLGVVAALAYSVYSLLAGGGHVYFEVAATILVAVTLGRWLEATGKLRTTEALRALQQLLPDTVRLVCETEEKTIAAGGLRPSDLFRVLPGERIAADGTILQFQASVDEQAVTGESLPVVKQPGDRVFSGTLVLDGPLLICATSAAGEGTLARMIDAVVTATASRNRYQRLAERISTVFLPTVSLVALATFAVHLSLGNHAGGLLAALAVLVIACPCALALATPMALWAAVGRAAQAGILIRNGDVLSRLACAKTICFDKTGTLTTGRPRVVDLAVNVGTNHGQLLHFASALVQSSNHPVAVAVSQYCAALGAEAAAASSLQSLPGRGIVGHFEELKQEVLLGSRRWLHERRQHWPERWPSPTEDDAAETLIAWDGQIRGRFVLQEEVRPDAARAIRGLRSRGIKPLMLTGDRQRRAAALNSVLGLEGLAELLPEAKLAEIQRLKHLGPVVMVGDGINDAPALAAADVGIALGSGTDISRHSAGVCLLGNDLARLPWLIELARQTDRTIRWNLVWAFAYNIAGIGLAAAGWLHPIVAALAMGVSSLLVVSNSLVLARFPLIDSNTDSAESVPASTSACAPLPAGAAP